MGCLDRFFGVSLPGVLVSARGWCHCRDVGGRRGEHRAGRDGLRAATLLPARPQPGPRLSNPGQILPADGAATLLGGAAGDENYEYGSATQRGTGGYDETQWSPQCAEKVGTNGEICSGHGMCAHTTGYCNCGGLWEGLLCERFDDEYIITMAPITSSPTVTPPPTPVPVPTATFLDPNAAQAGPSATPAPASLSPGSPSPGSPAPAPSPASGESGDDVAPVCVDDTCGRCSCSSNGCQTADGACDCFPDYRGELCGLLLPLRPPAHDHAGRRAGRAVAARPPVGRASARPTALLAVVRLVRPDVQTRARRVRRARQACAPQGAARTRPVLLNYLTSGSPRSKRCCPFRRSSSRRVPGLRRQQPHGRPRRRLDPRLRRRRLRRRGARTVRWMRDGSSWTCDRTRRCRSAPGLPPKLGAYLRRRDHGKPHGATRSVLSSDNTCSRRCSMALSATRIGAAVALACAYLCVLVASGSLGHTTLVFSLVVAECLVLTFTVTCLLGYEMASSRRSRCPSSWACPSTTRSTSTMPTASRRTTTPTPSGEARLRALETVGAPVFAAALTTFSSTFVLIFAQLLPFSTLGVIASINTAYAA